MDWWASTSTVGLPAMATAAAMVAGGLFSRLRATRRPVAARAVASLPPMSSSVGPRVMVVGRLEVEGDGCPRLEDGVPVAVTTYEPPRADGARRELRSERARSMWVKVGQVSIALEGPVVIDVGSEEQYPGRAPDGLEPAVQKRLAAAPRGSARARGGPLHGVFRSVKAGDQVAIVGRVERGAGDTWRLIPDASGALRLCYRRRPTVRDALFAVRDWAAA